MKKKIVSLALAVGIMVGIGLVTPSAVEAACTGVNCVINGANSANTGGDGTATVNSALKTIVEMLLFAIGAVSVVMIVIGGFKYVTSNGNAESIKSAKNTIMYAVIGIIVALLAYAVVNWVVTAFY